MRNLIKIAALALSLSDTCYADPDLLLTRVSLDQATHQIIKEHKLTVLGAHTEIIDGREIHIIKVLTADGHIRHYRIDAETGNPIH
ncbi:MAG: PepSY domain-containing protein [Methylococcaceae bacterium]|nr:PepSY domain-containing protein [Methylococcaceae bacterium]